MTPAKLYDIVSRTCSVMAEQRDDNGELIAHANHELYDELVTLASDVRACMFTAESVTFSGDQPLPSEQTGKD